MSQQNKAGMAAPSVEELEKQLGQERHKIRYRYALRSTVYILFAAPAVAILIATLWLPVLRIYGTSMNPTLVEGQLVIAFRGGRMEQGDIIAFHCNNKILVNRVIAGPGEWVDIGEDGTVSVNGEALEEPYLTQHSFGQCDIVLPYQVPEGQYFVLGDHRSAAVDSRSSTVGCVRKNQIVGRLFLRIWPLQEIRAVG